MLVVRALIPVTLMLSLAACGTTANNPPPPGEPNPPPPGEPNPPDELQTLPDAIADGLTVSGNSISGKISVVYVPQPGTPGYHLNQFGQVQTNPIDITLTQTPNSQLMTVDVGGVEYIVRPTPTNSEFDGYNAASFSSIIDGVSQPGREKQIKGTLLLGEYTSILILNDFEPTDLFMGYYVGWHYAYGGVQTPTNALPQQVVSYSGNWLTSVAGGMVPQDPYGPVWGTGTFGANADFDQNSIEFVISNPAGGEIGNGAGVITGSEFDSSFNILVGPMVSQNIVEGSFFGPDATEIAGAITGTRPGNNYSTTGLIWGTADE